jgi:hypothetical protein
MSTLTTDDFDRMFGGSQMTPASETVERGVCLPSSSLADLAGAEESFAEDREAEPARMLKNSEHGGYAWEVAQERAPTFRRLLQHYPSATDHSDSDFGRVLIVAYQSDRRRRIHRNAMVYGVKFFETDYIKALLDLDEPAFRVVVRMFPYRVGAHVRFWESHPNGDVADKSVTVVLGEQGLRRLRGRP